MREKDDSARGKILEAAKAEFMERGFAEASMRTIAERAGFTTGMLYSRFADKSVERIRARRRIRRVRAGRNVRNADAAVLRTLYDRRRHGRRIGRGKGAQSEPAAPRLRARVRHG